MTERVGLIGWPVKHSISPAMHNAAFAALSLDWHYDLLPIPTEELSLGFNRLLGEGYRGFNVTVPHKQALIAAVGRIQPDDSVQRIGAANTIIVKPDGSLQATNTDWQGFRNDLLAHNVDPTGWTCLILGTGGSARAVAYTLRQMGVNSITFASRTRSEREDVIHYDKLAVSSLQPELVVNCTPVGMWPEVGRSPWPYDAHTPPAPLIYDLVYNPAETDLMRLARAEGAHAIGGLGMLVQQGALAFEAWTGISPPLDVMTSAARKALEDMMDA